MNQEAIYLLKILRGFINQENPGVFHGDWDKLSQLAHQHLVSGILGYMVMTYPNETTKAIEQNMRQMCLGTILRQTNRAESMKQLSQQMHEQGIDHLMFKGYVLKDYYPVPELRTYGDIDLLIRTEDRKKSDELMMQLGFQKKTDWEPVYSYFKDIEYYEIHTDVMEVDVSDKADYIGYFKHIWEYAVLNEKHCWELLPEYHFLYLLTHIAKHITGSGAGIRMYLDIAVFIKHFEDKLNWDYIYKELETLCLTNFANVVLSVVQKYFNIRSPITLKNVDEDVLNAFMEFTIDGGIFGQVGRDSGLMTLKSQDRTNLQISRMDAFIKRLCPSAKTLEKRYTYLQSKPWLLPIAWVHRIIKTKDTWQMHIKEAKGIMSADKEEVLKLKKMYKEIGL